MMAFLLSFKLRSANYGVKYYIMIQGVVSKYAVLNLLSGAAAVDLNHHLFYLGLIYINTIILLFIQAF